MNDCEIVEFIKLPPNLEFLSLVKNMIVRIPSGIGYLHKLRTLHLSTNRLVDIPELPDNLEYLDLSRNEITHVPMGFGKLQKLKTLKISKNPIVDFPELKAMPALEQLEFVETKIPDDKYAGIDIPDAAVMQKLERIFPNARLSWSEYI